MTLFDWHTTFGALFLSYTYQVNEIVSLLLGSMCLLIFFFFLFFYRSVLHKLSYFFVGFAFIWLAYVTTLVEGFVWEKFFNAIEHVSIALAGVSFLIGCWRILRQTAVEEKHDDMV